MNRSVKFLVLFFSALLLSATIVAQDYDSTRSWQPVSVDGQIWKNGRVKGAFGIPRDTFKLARKDSGSIAWKNGVVYCWSGYSWSALANAGGFVDITPDWYDVQAHGGDNSGVSDVTAVVQNAINAGYKTIYFRAGTYKINSTIQMKDGVSIIGDGGQSVLKTTSDTTMFKCSLALGGSQSSFENIVLKGTYTTLPPAIGTTSNQIGILVDSAQNISIRDSRFTNFKGWGVRMLNNAFCCAAYVANAGKSNMVHNSTFDSSYTGLDFGPRAEYNNVTGCVFGTNYYALTVSAGNCRIDNNSMVNNAYGMYITQTSNGGHGVATGNTSNHNDVCLYINGVTNGFSFVNNVFARKMDGGLTVLEIMNSTNIKFIGGLAVANDTVRTTNCTNIAFIDQAYLSGDYRYVNVSGQPPTIIRNGIVSNTMSMKDVVNNKQFDLTHTNGSVGFTINGAPTTIKVGVGTASPDSILHIAGGGIKIVTGRQGAGKVLTSDAGGGADWATPSTPDTSTAITGLTTLYQNSLKLSTATAASTYLPLAGSAYTTTSGNGLALSSSTLTSGSLVSLSITGTAAASNTKTGLSITSSGANGAASQTVTGQTISVTNTGTTNTNVGLNVTATGANTNTAISATGSINATAALTGVSGSGNANTFTTNHTVNTSASYRGTEYASNITTSASNSSTITGQHSTVTLSSGSNLPTALQGYGIDVNVSGGAGTLNNVKGITIQGFVANGSTVTNVYGNSFVGLFTPSTGVVNNQYGYYYDQLYITPSNKGFAFYSNVNPSNGGTLGSSTDISIIPGANKFVGIATTAPASVLDVAGSTGSAITTISTNTTLDATHHTIIITSGTPTITLPAAASGNNRREYVIVNQTGAASTISTYLDFAGASATTIAANSSLTIQSNGSNWYRIQ